MATSAKKRANLTQDTYGVDDIGEWSQMSNLDFTNHNLDIIENPSVFANTVLSQDFGVSASQYRNEKPTIEEIGQNSAGWQSFLNGFESKVRYEKILHSFLTFRTTLLDDLPLHDQLIKFFDHNRSLVNHENQPRYKGSTLRGWFSVFKVFFSFAVKSDISKLAPIIENNLKKWEKQDSKTKAKTFTRVEMGNHDIAPLSLRQFHFHFII